MYLSVLKGKYGDDYRVHQLLMRDFTGQKILYQRRDTSIHVLSQNLPVANDVVSLNIDNVIQQIGLGDQLDFTLRINPTVSKKCDPSKKRGVLKAVPSNDLTRWLNNKFIKYGFVADFIYAEEGFRESKKGGSPISINSLLVNGTLEVLHPESIRRALINGIGRARGFGFGFLHVYDSLISEQ